MRNLFLSLVSALALAACSQPGPRDAHVEVENAWVRLPAVPGRPAAAYFHIRTDVGPLTLIGVDSPLAGRAEMHKVERGRMTPVARVPIGIDESLTFAPGGYHVMLFDIAREVRPGGTMPLRLTFEGDPPPAEVAAKVVGPADPAP